MDAQVPGPEIDLRNLLKQARLRVTLPRLEVLRVFAAEREHFSVEDLAARLQGMGVTLPKASIYNAINDFVRAGILLPVDFGAGRTFFEFASAAHPHAICRRCGSIQDLPPHFLSLEKLDVPGFKTERTQLVFYGLCSNCLSAARLE